MSSGESNPRRFKTPEEMGIRIHVDHPEEGLVLEDFNSTLLTLENDFSQRVPYLRAGSDKEAQAVVESFNRTFLLWKNWYRSYLQKGREGRKCLHVQMK